MHEGEDRFLEALVADVDDDVLRGVYADWLEERGDPRAAWLRGEVELHGLLTAVPEDGDAEPSPPDEAAVLRVRRRLAEVEDLDVGWLSTVTRLPIENCDLWSRMARLQFRCPGKWDALQPTVTDGVRFCGVCRRQVFFCPTREAAQLHARAGNRVAVSPDVEREPGDLDDVEMMLGEMAEANEEFDPDAARPLARVFRAVQRVLMQETLPGEDGAIDDGAIEDEAIEDDDSDVVPVDGPPDA